MIWTFLSDAENKTSVDLATVAAMQFHKQPRSSLQTLEISLDCGYVFKFDISGCNADEVLKAWEDARYPKEPNE